MAPGGVVKAPIRAGTAQRDCRKVGAGPADAVHHDAMPRTLALIEPVAVLVAPATDLSRVHLDAPILPTSEAVVLMAVLEVLRSAGCA
jgi:hypothetical protein